MTVFEDKSQCQSPQWEIEISLSISSVKEYISTVNFFTSISTSTYFMRFNLPLAEIGDYSALVLAQAFSFIFPTSKIWRFLKISPSVNLSRKTSQKWAPAPLKYKEMRVLQALNNLQSQPVGDWISWNMYWYWYWWRDSQWKYILSRLRLKKFTVRFSISHCGTHE